MPIVTREPWSSLEKMSRPAASWPMMWLKLGGAWAFGRSILLGSWTAIQGAKIAPTVNSNTMAEPNMASR